MLGLHLATGAQRIVDCADCGGTGFVKHCVGCQGTGRIKLDDTAESSIECIECLGKGYPQPKRIFIS